MTTYSDGGCRIWVDADSCPAAARNVILTHARRTGTPVIYVANRPIPFSQESPLFQMEVCGTAADAADSYIIGHSTGSDLVITRDIPLAARLVERHVTVINDRGLQFNAENAAAMLRERALSLQMKELGIRPGMRRHTYGQAEARAFEACFRAALARLLAQAEP